jgi:hypothetical protein
MKGEEGRGQIEGCSRGGTGKEIEVEAEDFERDCFGRKA